MKAKHDREILELQKDMGGLVDDLPKLEKKFGEVSRREEQSIAIKMHLIILQWRGMM